MQVKINPNFTVSTAGKSNKELLNHGDGLFVFTNEEEDALCVAVDNSQPHCVTLMVTLLLVGATIESCKIIVGENDYQEAENQLNSWLDSCYSEEDEDD